jgi:hypothetical protein
LSPALLLNNFRFYLLAAILLISAGTGTYAQTLEQHAPQMKRAFLQLMLMVDAAQEIQEIPRLDNRKFDKTFSLAFDFDKLQTPAPGVEDLAYLVDLQQHSHNLVRAFLSTGTRMHQSQAASGKQEYREAGENFIEFLPEIAKAYDFNATIGAKIADIVMQVASEAEHAGTNNDTVNSALAVIAAQQVRIIQIIIGCVSDSRIDSSWRVERLRHLNQLVENYAALFSHSDSMAIADQALAAAINEEDQELAHTLKQFALTVVR